MTTLHFSIAASNTLSKANADNYFSVVTNMEAINYYNDCVRKGRWKMAQDINASYQHEAWVHSRGFEWSMLLFNKKNIDWDDKHEKWALLEAQSTLMELKFSTILEVVKCKDEYILVNVAGNEIRHVTRNDIESVLIENGYKVPYCSWDDVE